MAPFLSSSNNNKNNNNKPTAATKKKELVASSSSGSERKLSESTMFGTDRIDPEPIKPTLGSFPRSVGPLADIRELEYISSLHQNAEAFLRLDGTICSKDIAPYLSSRYGMDIAPAQAVDIAVNLCGGKVRSQLSREQDAKHALVEERYEDYEVGDVADNVLEKLEDDGKNASQEEEEEEVYYFDLVQLMSLLLIGELVELADRQDDKTEDCFSQRANKDDASSFNMNNTIKRGTERGGLFDLVIASMTEAFDDRMQKDIRNGRRPLDKDLLSIMLEASGDLDAAANDELLDQMLELLDGKQLTANTFLQAVTSDVRSYSSNQKRKSGILDNDDPTTAMQTSSFYDIFGRNWENAGMNNDSTGDMKGAPAPLKTASFIDYAADTYGSVMLNTTVWCLFLMTTLVYLNFFLTMLDGQTGGLFCPDKEHFRCTVGNKVVGWILTALFCGLYGVFVIVPISVGNVAGKTPLLYFTLVITALFTYAPFSTLIWYRQGMPYTVEEDVRFEIICPNWIGNYSETVAAQQAIANAPDGAQYYMKLDSSCHTADSWCESHPEIQGKYIDNLPDRLSYAEFEKCYSFFEDKLVDDFPFKLWLETGDECDPFNTTESCPNRGACGLKSLENITYVGSNVTNTDTLFEDYYICCPSGHAVPFQSTRYQDAGSDFVVDDIANVVCVDQALGETCLDDSMCEFGAVCAENNTCVIMEGSSDEEGDGRWLGEPCTRSNDMCRSGFCWEGICQEMPTICPIEDLEILGGFKLDPFCRTKEDWCSYTSDFASTFANFVDTPMFATANDFICDALLNFTVELDLVRVLDENDAEVGYIYNTTVHNDVEEILDKEWAYLVLLSIAVVGFFALVAILRKVLASHSDARPRDYKIKSAASNKLTNVIENALALHTQGSHAKGRLMRNYFLRGEEKVEIGGLIWTFKNLLSGYISTNEGIRYPGRIWIGQVSQIVVTIVGILFAGASILRLGESIDEERAELSSSFTNADVQDISNEEWATYTLDELVVTNEEQTILDLLPERWMFDAAAIPAAIAGSLVAIFCILVYIPSTTNTIMKLRTGQLPSLHDPFFPSYRKTPDNVVQNIGNMVFALAGASAVMAMLIFFIIFAFTYQHTRDFAINYVAIAIGIVCTMVIKIVGQKLLRARNFSSFYRKKPAAANIANLFFECWYIGTGALVVVTRLVMFLLSSALWLGRIDVEFLDPNVKILGIGLDKLPVSFKRDILVHEAHNHPYIHRLGAMYLLRLRDGDSFGSVAGTTWRCLFVAGLMPWIVKHKVNSNDEASLELAVQNDRRGSMMQSTRLGSVANLRMSMQLSTAKMTITEDADLQKDDGDKLQASFSKKKKEEPPASSEPARKARPVLPSDQELRSSRRASFLQEDSIRSIVSI